MRVQLAAAVLCIAVTVGCSRSPSGAGEQLDRFEFHAGDVVETVRGAAVRAGFFEQTKTAPLLGRVFLREEHEGPRGQVAVLAFSLWQRRLGADPAILGRTVQLNGRDFVVVGIMPRSFTHPPGAEVWIPQSESGGR